MMKRKFLSLLLSVYSVILVAQFSPPAGFPGSAAINKDSSVFVGWATGCEVNIEWQNISDTSLGKANAGTAAAAIGKAGENGTVSLGDGGIATLTFAAPIFNGPGADFAVFENAFIDSFLEFAFVEVSSDGVNFVRFPAISNIQDTIQTPGFGLSDCSLVYNLAGTFRANFGTPFDLEELRDSGGIDLDNISYIRIKDVVGSINPLYATYSSNGKKINDPWPTDFPSSGFDLDAVGAIHQKPASVSETAYNSLSVYPNPASDFVCTHEKNTEVIITDIAGRIIKTQTDEHGRLCISQLKNGIYLISIETEGRRRMAGLVKND